MPVYHSGFHSYVETEALNGALPKEQNSPQHPSLGLFAEQVNNSAFTAPRAENFKAWQYRIRPSVLHCSEPELITQHLIRDIHHKDSVLTPPTQMRWNAREITEEKVDVISSLVTMVYNSVAAVHLYAANSSMDESYFYSADGDWLYVLEEGALRFKTEMGIIEASVGEIVVIPRGIRYQIELLEGVARGYICESQQAFYLPERGPIGANGLAEERHFLAPDASFENKEGDFSLYAKFQGQLWKMKIPYSPLDVVAWHGNLYPYKYNLKLFSPVNAVLKDHSDPSIFTVLSAPSLSKGTANIDFVIFPPRWVVAEGTFRPPYYHRNIMSEFMGLIQGQYDAKEEGFFKGCSSLHNPMSAHGPDMDVYTKASNEELKPVRYKDTLAFMFESKEPWQVTNFALNSVLRQKDYLTCWQSLETSFKEIVIEK